ncbi:MAG: Na+/H+ antiporter subunit E [Lachnospiraceae bacterium]|nr:Na+/H+ antiporter subunit E [Lachnospiraceae bacterium]
MFILFFLLWIIFNGTISTEIALFGIGISAAIFFFVCKFMDYSIKKEIILIKILPLLLEYALLLIWEIIKANFVTAKYILNQKIEIEPQLIHFNVPLQTDIAKVILANSITLTPGTITVSLEGDEYRVHCLDSDLAEGIFESIFVKKLFQIERKMKGLG